MLLLYDNYWLVSLLLLMKSKRRWQKRWHRKVEILVIAESLFSCASDKKDIRVVLKSYDVNYHMNYYSEFDLFLSFQRVKNVWSILVQKRRRFFKYSLFVLHKKNSINSVKSYESNIITNKKYSLGVLNLTKIDC